MPQSSPVVSIAVLLVAALIGGMIAHRLRQPVILGYLIVGIALGPHALGLVGDLVLVEAAATMGVALLMFTLGLEVSVAQLRQVGKVGLWGGITQILVTFALGFVVGAAVFGWSISQAALFGLIISLSSTMVCLKVLMERGDLDSVHGRIMIAILILQDVAVVFMAVVQPILGESMANLLFALGIAFGKAILFVGIAVVLGLWVLPWLMGRVGGVRSRELFLLTVLVLCLGAALSTQIFGLSVVFGAFIIGLVLRETRFAHQALAEITPLRDIFATLFFVSLGMLLSPRFMVENWSLVAITVGIIILLKFLVVFGIIRLFGYSGRIAILTGAGLFQIGEFSFILARGGIEMGIISDQFYSLILASAIITMLLTPVSFSVVSWLYPRLQAARETGKMATESVSFSPLPKSSELISPVVIAGYGRIGRNIARGLRKAGIPYVIIEIDPELIYELRCGGENCIYGDASNIRVLSKVDLTNAKVFVVTYPDPIAVTTTVREALRLNPGLKIVVRVHRAKEAELLKNLKGVELVNPEYEASLEFLRIVLAVSGCKEADIKQALAVMCQEREIIEFGSKEEE